MGTDLKEPLILSSGLRLPNRLVKAAMAEQMAKGDCLPDESMYKAYTKWAEGGWGLVLTGICLKPLRFMCIG
jgi:2,4-dienoyl-CoA reductase-like NADH-dependent reductase (Old Yellow Enzyme family)